MHDRQLINPPELHPAPGFSHVALGTGRRVACFAGQVALAPDFSVIGGSDLGEQTRAAMRNLESAMKAVGADWEDIVRRTIYTTDPTQFEVITKAIEGVTGSTEHPAQTIIGVTGLALPGLLIEIEATALLD
jgi:enamine deaminase RidA (YjgF/YER057c/UK114 family)